MTRDRERESATESGPLDAVPTRALVGVGPRTADRLARIGIHTVQDLLFHLPLRYQDRTRVVTVGALRPGEAAVVDVRVRDTRIGYGRRRTLTVTAGDDTGVLGLRFFHFSAAQRAALAEGTRLCCFGEARPGRDGLEMIHPEYRVVGEGEAISLDDGLTPWYPTTDGLAQTALRKLTGQALAYLDGPREVPELLSPGLLRRLGYPSLGDALRLVHRPRPGPAADTLAAGRHPARRRLAFEELLAHHASLRAVRLRRTAQDAPILGSGRDLASRFLTALPFDLTAAQRRVLEEISADLARPHPMHRLLQGDVGSGKTVIAALAALAAVESGYQAALMAPTELLAEQHRRTLDRWLSPLGIEVAWLSGTVTGRARDEALAAIAGRRAPVVVGTHALYQTAVAFGGLGLVVVDEQHRFGVHQRLALWEKGSTGERRPHQLTMTATPIPRTLAMTAYADLDTSRLDEMPPGRRPVETVAIPAGRRTEVTDRVHRACREGRQAFWVCPLIEESDSLQYQAASDTAERLARDLPDLRIGLLHGRLGADEKGRRMGAFERAEVDVLVATTVVEVGVDVPNASLMVIENAERMGLAQLHQLRGRVGRGEQRSTCVLLYEGPLSPAARARIAAVRECHDGFTLAERDLELRGPGELLGTRQAGLLDLRLADLRRDGDLLPEVERAATELLEADPARIRELARRWLRDAEDLAGV